MRRAALLTALVICALPAPAVAATSITRVQFSGDGGTFGAAGGSPGRSHCRPNRALVGLHGAGSRSLDTVAPLCRRLVLIGSTLVPFGAVDRGPWVGTHHSSYRNYPFSCPEGKVATGITGLRDGAWDGSGATRITSLVLECFALDPNGRATGARTQVFQGEIYGREGNFGGIVMWPIRSCPDGVPMGVHGFADWTLRRLGPACGQVVPAGDNREPAVSAAAVDVAGSEGETLTASGRFADPDGDAMDVTLASWSPGTLTDRGDGSWRWSHRPGDDAPPTEVLVVATDDFGATATDGFSFEATNVAPALQPTLIADGAANCRPTLQLAWTDPGADMHVATVDWGDGSEPELHDEPGLARHAYATAGTYTVHATVRDDDGGSDERSLPVRVRHPAAIAQPINPDGSSRFPNGSTLAIRARVTRCDGQVPLNLQPGVGLERLGSPVAPARANEPYTRERATAGGAMLLDRNTSEYVFVIDSLTTRLIDFGQGPPRGAAWRVSINHTDVERASATFQFVP